MSSKQIARANRQQIEVLDIEKCLGIFSIKIELGDLERRHDKERREKESEEDKLEIRRRKRTGKRKESPWPTTLRAMGPTLCPFYGPLLLPRMRDVFWPRNMETHS